MSWDAVIVAGFALASSAVLVITAKVLGAAFVSGPAGSRVGELGDLRDDLDGGEVHDA